jgi:hypothetical protein
LDDIKAKRILQNLGLLIYIKRSIYTPVQAIKFLGFIIESIAMILYLPLEKVKKISKNGQEVLRSDRVSKKLSKLIENLTASLQAMHQSP